MDENAAANELNEDEWRHATSSNPAFDSLKETAEDIYTVMNAQTEAQVAEDEQIRQEHSLVIDGVIAIPTDIDPDAFFDRLLDKLIEYVEEHHGYAGLGMSHKKYEGEAEDELADGSQAT
ncbi:MAG TPA: hypothetical protein VFF70_05530 [Anaerolineae bacterium]|nr:hypothetical protein [Anaerolineae bacterium]